MGDDGARRSDVTQVVFKDKLSNQMNFVLFKLCKRKDDRTVREVYTETR